MNKTNKYNARLAASEKDVHKTQILRSKFYDTLTDDCALDSDIFDAKCKHVLIEDTATGELHACFRFMYFPNGNHIDTSYSAQYYDLSRLKMYEKPMIEIGRFCISSDVQDYEPYRVAWAYLTAYIDQNDISLMFGCSSFYGTDAEKYTDAFALLNDWHLAPEIWKPLVKSDEVIVFTDYLVGRKPNLKEANKNLPPLLRSYLGIGGWVSDHAVVDRNLETLHVLTGVEVKAIPAARVRVLRSHAKALGM
jgi:putative hemolysin